MSEVFVGLLQPFAFPFAPSGWMICNGTTLPIDQYEALFTLIGTTYGGNGTTNFAIPDTRGRTLIGQGHFPGGDNFAMGQKAGTETVTLTSQNLPAHTHILFSGVTAANSDTPGSSGSLLLDRAGGSSPVSGDPLTVHVYGPSGANVPMQEMGPAGGNQPAPIMQPFLVNNYCIALYGIYPSRN